MSPGGSDPVHTGGGGLGRPLPGTGGGREAVRTDVPVPCGAGTRQDLSPFLCPSPRLSPGPQPGGSPRLPLCGAPGPGSHRILETPRSGSSLLPTGQPPDARLRCRPRPCPAPPRLRSAIASRTSPFLSARPLPSVAVWLQQCPRVAGLHLLVAGGDLASGPSHGCGVGRRLGSQPLLAPDPQERGGPPSGQDTGPSARRRHEPPCLAPLLKDTAPS